MASTQILSHAYRRARAGRRECQNGGRVARESSWIASLVALLRAGEHQDPAAAQLPEPRTRFFLIDSFCPSRSYRERRLQSHGYGTDVVQVPVGLERLWVKRYELTIGFWFLSAMHCAHGCRSGVCPLFKASNSERHRSRLTVNGGHTWDQMPACGVP